MSEDDRDTYVAALAKLRPGVGLVEGFGDFPATGESSKASPFGAAIEDITLAAAT